MSIRENLEEIRRRLAAAARRAGQRLFGENRVQEFAAKAGELGDLEGAEFHLIGHLQSNKAGKAAELFHAVDSVDSLRLLEKLDSAAAKAGKHVSILVEVNVGGEEQKSGMTPDSPELLQIVEAAATLKSVELRGLMTVPPYTDDPEGARPYFRALRELRDRLASRFPGAQMNTLSMGMSHDFEVAIEEGSTCVRIGSAIFGARDKQ